MVPNMPEMKNKIVTNTVLANFIICSNANYLLFIIKIYAVNRSFFIVLWGCNVCFFFPRKPIVRKKFATLGSLSIIFYRLCGQRSAGRWFPVPKTAQIRHPGNADLFFVASGRIVSKNKPLPADISGINCLHRIRPAHELCSAGYVLPDDDFPFWSLRKFVTPEMPSSFLLPRDGLFQKVNLCRLT